MKFIDPLQIKEEDFPLIVFSDDLRGFFSFGIKIHTEGAYSHSMIMVKEGKVVTQGWTYKEMPIQTYMSSRYRLKFWKVKGLTEEDKSKIRFAINEDLSQNWWHKSYDILGIIGQLFRIRRLNNPKKYYCSERVAKYLRLMNWLKDLVPLHPSPSKLNKLFKEIPDMEVFGYWFSD